MEQSRTESRQKKEELMEEKKGLLEEEKMDGVSGGSAGSCGGDCCPKCGSGDIKFIGFIADHELVNFRCNTCGHYWEEIA